MKVIIVGCGKVGYTLAETLSNEGHDITVVDSSAQKLEGLANSLDVQCVTGNGASYRVLEEAGAKLVSVGDRFFRLGKETADGEFQGAVIPSYSGRLL